MNILTKAAIKYKQAGYSIVGVKSNKRSFQFWREYQKVIMPDEILLQTFNHPSVNGIAILCGRISQNLEVIDLDSRNDLTGTLYSQYIDRVCNENAKLAASLPIALTKNNGYHFFYKCREIERSKSLARRHCNQEEIKRNPHQKLKVLIETRGTGGYIIVHPTPGYRFIQHDLQNVPIIHPNERMLLLTIARSFDQFKQQSLLPSYPEILNNDPCSPFNDYDNRGNIIDLLKSHGWEIVRATPIRTYFRRPGDTIHETSGDYHHQKGLFGVFSTSTEFEPGKGYRPYAVYAILECNGDFKLAAKKLLAEGYGISYKSRRL